ncbi:hypothetical protein IAU60_000079 [Kwoniella sp. DSM 27419]
MAQPSLPTSSADAIDTKSYADPAPMHRRVISRFERLVNAPDSTDLISIYACMLTGLTSGCSFTACFVWCGFQTGNIAQLGIAIARTFANPRERTHAFMKVDQQALTSLLSFWIGASLGRVGDRIGARTRTWLVGSCFLQALLAGFAALTAHYSGESGIGATRGEPSWATPLGMVTLGFISATMGIQGIVGKRVGSPMNTTVVLTTTWVEIFNDPNLFSFKFVKSRDVRVAGALALLFGGFISRALVDKIAQPGALGVLAGLRMVQVVWWYVLPDKPAKADKPDK